MLQHPSPDNRLGVTAGGAFVEKGVESTGCPYISGGYRGCTIASDISPIPIPPNCIGIIMYLKHTDTS